MFDASDSEHNNCTVFCVLNYTVWLLHIFAYLCGCHVAVLRYRNEVQKHNAVQSVCYTGCGI